MLQGKPLIGISMDHETEKTYSKYPWYALRENYSGSIMRSGGIPLPLPHEVELIDTYIDLIDGLLITGGAFDVDPTLYGQNIASDTVQLKNRRTAFEYGMTKRALELKKPIFGICGGEQLLNVVLGGTLIQHIPDVIDTTIEHEQPNPRHEAGHMVDIVANTLLSSIVREKEIAVNSAHHQAVEQVGAGVVVNAYAPDGVIEGIEYTDHPFCIGVQWHPEFFITGADEAIYRAFIGRCQRSCD